jgi:hypothetical protein
VPNLLFLGGGAGPGYYTQRWQADVTVVFGGSPILFMCVSVQLAGGVMSPLSVSPYRLCVCVCVWCVCVCVILLLFFILGLKAAPFDGSVCCCLPVPSLPLV